jgi:hypothetical protein
MPKLRSKPSKSFDSFELTLSDVYLLTRDDQGQVAVPGLGVVVDTLGMTVTKPDGSVVSVLKWGDLKTLRTAQRVQLPSGPPAVAIDAISDARTHRFLVPTDDPEGLEAVIGDLEKFKVKRDESRTHRSLRTILRRR